jgi:hypothetical protein
MFESLIAEYGTLVSKLELLSTLMLAGLIWTIQLLHYPLLLKVAPADFVAYEASHCTRIAWLVVPLMCTELVSSFALTAGNYLSTGSFDSARGAGFGLVIIIWCSTAFIQVPLHQKLALGYDAATIRRLVATNWLRTIAWSVRALLLVES